MQVQLNQSEIEVAVTNYIGNVGINTQGKDISISFTAGRKETGISAEITIGNSSEVPKLNFPADEPKEPTLRLVKEPEPSAEVTEDATTSDDVVGEDPEPVQEEDKPSTKSKTNSLFNT